MCTNEKAPKRASDARISNSPMQQNGFHFNYHTASYKEVLKAPFCQISNQMLTVVFLIINSLMLGVINIRLSK